MDIEIDLGDEGDPDEGHPDEGDPGEGDFKEGESEDVGPIVINYGLPGLVVLRGAMTVQEQVLLAQIAMKDIGSFQRPINRHNALMNVKCFSWGMPWNARTGEYQDDGTHPIPELFTHIAHRAYNHAKTVDPDFQSAPFYPQTTIGNLYGQQKGHEKKIPLGWHKDQDESKEVRDSGSPVIGISLGSPMVFEFVSNTQPVQMHVYSGDIIIFGGSSRMLKHRIFGFSKDTDVKTHMPDDLATIFGDFGLSTPVRLSLTLRQVRPFHRQE
jgi:alkylated DNA repair dioxygenase AlkB